MDASIKESVKASDKEAQYDEKAKKLLGHKIILAYILVNTVEEFQGMNPEDVVKYIEGEPYISTVPLDPGMTNTKERKEGSIKETETPEQIRGLNTENSELNEGMMRFDIIFYVRMKDGLTQIIVNIEAQKEEPPVRTAEAEPADAGVNPILLEFLDADTLEEKIHILTRYRNQMDEGLLNSIAISLDLVVEKKNLQEKYDEIMNCISMMKHFECNRLR